MRTADYLGHADRHVAFLALSSILAHAWAQAALVVPYWLPSWSSIGLDIGGCPVPQQHLPFFRRVSALVLQSLVPGALSPPYALHGRVEEGPTVGVQRRSLKSNGHFSSCCIFAPKAGRGFRISLGFCLCRLVLIDEIDVQTQPRGQCVQALDLGRPTDSRLTLAFDAFVVAAVDCLGFFLLLHPTVIRPPRPKT